MEVVDAVVLAMSHFPTNIVVAVGDVILAMVQGGWLILLLAIRWNALIAVDLEYALIAEELGLVNDVADRENTDLPLSDAIIRLIAKEGDYL